MSLRYVFEKFMKGTTAKLLRNDFAQQSVEVKASRTMQFNPRRSVYPTLDNSSLKITFTGGDQQGKMKNKNGTWDIEAKTTVKVKKR